MMRMLTAITSAAAMMGAANAFMPPTKAVTERSQVRVEAHTRGGGARRGPDTHTPPPLAAVPTNAQHHHPRTHAACAHLTPHTPALRSPRGSARRGRAASSGRPGPLHPSAAPCFAPS
jgi:hypothetical protein